MRILLVEDDESISRALEAILTEHHYVVDVAADGQIGWECVEAFTYDLIVLDVLLPRLDGIQFCQQLRAQDCQIPVLLLTAQSSSRDRIIGLDAGADDYMVKPFEPQELLARLRVLLRRKGSARPAVLEWMALRLDPSLCEVTYDGHLVSLTPKEYRLLELFLRHPQRIFSRSVILDHLWSCEEAPGEDTVTVHIKGLRQKLKRQGAPPDLIQTVYGQGYRLKQPSEFTASPPALPGWVRDGLVQQKTRAGLADVWAKYKHLNCDRCLVLEQAGASMLVGTLTEELHQQACRTAHQLAGALGIFGLTDGSNLARRIEHLLQSSPLPTPNKAVQLLDLLNQLKEAIQSPPSHHNRVPLLLVIEDDEELADQVFSLAMTYGIEMERLPSLLASHEHNELPEIDEAGMGLGGEPVLLLNLTAGEEKRLTLPATYSQQAAPPLVLFIANQNNLNTRVKAARLGAHVFLDKTELQSLVVQMTSNFSCQAACPTRPLAAQILEVVKQAKSHVCTTTAKVMVVDDDPQILAGIRALLEPWGLQLITLEEPRQFWQTLETFSPDLLLLDVQMPHFSGFELCRVVRNAPRWKDLPVLFLTMHLDTAKVQQAIAAGGDDYVSKATDTKELVTCILNRLEHTRLRRLLSSSTRSAYE
ncbi:response regulator with CheY-like receiver domain and winged-helix DNA-binding domain [Leptolyngbyaceae cyanobacterium JSC-12]|nr:response regulator with CheY-like receiver domain and winged-helix DNA-binding domain [Leptolyngbyaceae cyanobacterium JSC-12]